MEALEITMKSAKCFKSMHEFIIYGVLTFHHVMKYPKGMGLLHC